ncbi:unnamed protein product [Linum tenue]|uniref:Aminotransferase-like plant mobile domain-containing protein n=1 Tax=Linum tenue TaxID=586396 RepID=A0AAV0NXX0_9ROSI|nr:unnamed protein product [Linum tenue]
MDSIRHFNGIKIDRQLITALVERWRKETRCFNFREGECTNTLKDIAILTDLPIDGDVICVDSTPPPKVVANMSGSQHFIWTVTGLCPPEKGDHDADGHPALSKGQVSITWLTAEIRRKHNPEFGGIPLTEESSERDKDIYARIYILGMIGGVFFPKKSNNLISNSWLKIILGSWDDMGNLSWASACLAHFYRSLCNASARAVKEIDWAMFIVQIWAWEHLPWIAPKVDPDKEWGPDHPLRHEAYGCRWLGEKNMRQPRSA